MELTREYKFVLLKRILRYSTRKENGCLICYASFNTSGRPVLYAGDKNRLVSRLIMHLMVDFPLDSELNVLHRDELCSSKACVEYDHLKIGNQSENMRDTIKKHGSFNIGKRKSHCKWSHLRTPETISYNGTCILCTREKDAKRRKKG